MANTLDDIEAFLAVARAGGFRKATGGRGLSASALSEAVRRLEGRLGVRLLHRTTRSVGLTEAGRRLSERLGSALAEVGAALDEAASLADQPAGALRLNVPVSAARLSLPRLLPRAVQFSILGGEFDDGGEVERGAVAGILDVVGA